MKHASIVMAGLDPAIQLYCPWMAALEGGHDGIATLPYYVIPLYCALTDDVLE